MKRYCRGYRVLGMVLLVLALTSSGSVCSATGLERKDKARILWSPTSPAVNETHIFEGYVNRKDNPVGFHSRPGGRDPARARVAAITESPNKVGVYTAQVEIRGSGRKWLSKQSTFFPDRMSRKEVVQAVLHAYHHATSRNSVKFSGPSGKGFTIQGYLLQDGKINTAFPVYRRDQ